MSAREATALDGVRSRTVDPRAGYRAAQRRESMRAFLLAVPLLIFLAMTFIVPIGKLLIMSVKTDEVANAVPKTAALLARWPGPPALPSRQTFEALAADLQAAQDGGTLASAARRLNTYEPGFRSLLLKTVRQMPIAEGEQADEALLRIDRRWGEPETWRLLGRAAHRWTPDFLLTAMDHRVGVSGAIEPVEPSQAIYVGAFVRTFAISASVALICLVLGYPVAFLLATLPARQSNFLMIFVIVPFWTSLLVRTTAWYVLLQPNGVFNALLIRSGLTTAPMALMFNRTGVLIGMTHVLLPFMILANYAVMRGISPAYQRAAVSLGAHPALAFLRIYVPLTLPGIGTGAFLVFVLALGYYITPALLGGAGDEMISQLVALQMDRQLNWGLAGALSVYLVVFTLAVYVVFNRLVGIDRLRLG
ncbi:ABC transporter permease [Lichenifustis flavocetrariae]|uniref:ABC transporter permease n=1 Tax=Lichenifustis flavocetrariae TaxID=2949735 RepID=A0AA41YWF6_9HYPH|nr:ABC transporter permease [Lichenifustis flavocetrariae]MCW6508407.1 ABC transporter permease [Lichenifustis flavocetrariae]